MLCTSLVSVLLSVFVCKTVTFFMFIDGIEKICLPFDIVVILGYGLQ